MWCYPYMILNKALMFQATFLGSNLSSSGYVSQMNELYLLQFLKLQSQNKNWGNITTEM